MVASYNRPNSTCNFSPFVSISNGKHKYSKVIDIISLFLKEENYPWMSLMNDMYEMQTFICRNLQLLEK